MAREWEIEKSSSRPTILNPRFLGWVGFLLYFLLFPGVLVFLGLEYNFSLLSQTRKESVRRLLSKILGRVDPYKNDEFFYPRYFRTVLKSVEGRPEPLAELQNAVKTLKRRFPGKLEFVVWDEKGNVVESITDLKGYRFVLKKAADTLRQVWENANLPKPLPIDSLSSISANFKVIKSLLGNLLVKGHLLLPVSKDQPSLILASFESAKRYVWYGFGKKFGMMVFVNKNAVGTQVGLQTVIRIINSKLKSVHVGFCEAGKIEKIEIPKKFGNKEDLIRSLVKQSASLDPFYEGKEHFVMVKIAGSKIRVFALIPRSTAEGSLTNLKIFFLLLFWIATISIVVLSFQILVLRKELFFSVRWRLILLFFYANGLPLLILGFLGFDYLKNKRVSLIQSYQAKAERSLRNFDAGIVRLHQVYSEYLNHFLAKWDLQYKNEPFDRKKLLAFEKALRKLNPQEFYLVGRSSQTIHEKIRVKTMGVAAKFVRGMFSDGISYLNGESNDMKNLRNAGYSIGFKTKPELIMREFVRFLGKTRLMTFGIEQKWIYVQVFGSTRLGIDNYIFVAIWSKEDLIRSYLRNFLQHLRRTEKLLKFFVQEKGSRKIFPLKGHERTNLQSYFDQVHSRGSVFIEKAAFENRLFFGVGLAGKEIENHSLICLVPYEIVEKSISTLRNQMMLFALVNILLSVAIGLVLSRQFLIPLQEIGAAAIKIGKRQFRFQIPKLSNDEFGKLGEVFNRMIESLEELEVARIVQETLFPLSRFSRGNFVVFGKSLSVSRLGGDFFDFIEISPEITGIVFGDANLRGVPAALHLAMTKAAILLDDETKKSGPTFIKSFHSLFEKLSRSSTVPMKLQYLQLDSSKKIALITNSGQMMPLVFRAQKTEVERIFAQEAKLSKAPQEITEVEISLSPGDALVLCSDGLLNAADARGEFFGIDGIEKAIIAYSNLGLEDICGKILAACASRRTLQDDATCVVIGCTE